VARRRQTAKAADSKRQLNLRTIKELWIVISEKVNTNRNAQSCFSPSFSIVAVVVAFASMWPMRYIEKPYRDGRLLAIAITFFFIAFYSDIWDCSGRGSLGGVVPALG
jgi:hypothetical protein